MQDTWACCIVLYCIINMLIVELGLLSDNTCTCPVLISDLPRRMRISRLHWTPRGNRLLGPWTCRAPVA